MAREETVVNQGKRCPFMGYYYSCHLYEDEDIITFCHYLEGPENRMHGCPANIAKGEGKRD